MGAGINLFKQLFPESFYAYQTATLISSKPVSKVVVGKNLINNSVIFADTTLFTINSDNSVTLLANDGRAETNMPYITLKSGTYTLSGFNANGATQAYYNDNGTWVWLFNGTATSCSFTITKTINLYLKFATSGSFPQTIKPQLEFGSTATAYEPYEEHTYPLGSDELRGLLKVENGNLVAFGDVHNSDGTGIKYFEERAYVSGDENLPNAITDGTNTVVALATPTPTTYTPFTNPMISGATEEFTDTRSVKMFCGHDSLYYTSNFKYW